MDPQTVQLIVALIPVAVKLLEIAGPEVAALLEALIKALPQHQAALGEAFAEMQRRLGGPHA